MHVHAEAACVQMPRAAEVDGLVDNGRFDDPDDDEEAEQGL